MSRYKTYDDLVESSPKTTLPEDNITPIQSMDHKKKILKGSHFVCVKVWNENCKPCIDTIPAYADLARKYNNPGLIHIVKEDSNNGLSNVSAVPAFLFYSRASMEPFRTVYGANIPEVESVLKQMVDAVKKSQESK